MSRLNLFIRLILPPWRGPGRLRRQMIFFFDDDDDDDEEYLEQQQKKSRLIGSIK